MRAMRSAWALVAMLLLLAGCGDASVAGQASGGDYKLYEATYTTQSPLLAVIDSRTHATDRKLAVGTPSPDWRHLYSLTSGSLIDTNPQTGSVLHKLSVSEAYQLPPATISGLPGGLSPNGDWLVVETWDRNSGGTPIATRFLMFNTSFAAAPARIALTGYFEFDAVSNDGSRIYLIEYLGGSDYRVRLFDVSQDRLDPTVVVDKSNPSESMTGSRVMGIASADGQWLFSIYVRQNSGAFVHALNLDAPFAYCIDLPGSGYAHDGNEFQWALAMSPDGQHLYASNAAMGVVSEIDARTADLVRTVQISTSTGVTGSLVTTVEAKSLGNNGAVVSADGGTLVTAAAAGIVWIDTVTLQVRARILTDWRVSSLGLSPDGKTLYAVRDSGSIAQISMAGHAVEDSFDPRAGDPMALMRVAPA